MPFLALQLGKAQGRGRWRLSKDRQKAIEFVLNTGVNVSSFFPPRYFRVVGNPARFHALIPPSTLAIFQVAHDLNRFGILEENCALLCFSGCHNNRQDLWPPLAWYLRIVSEDASSLPGSIPSLFNLHWRDTNDAPCIALGASGNLILPASRSVQSSADMSFSSCLFVGNVLRLRSGASLRTRRLFLRLIN